MSAPHTPTVTTTSRLGEPHLTVQASCSCRSYSQTFHVLRPAWPTSGAPIDPLAFAEEQGRRLHAYHLAEITPAEITPAATPTLPAPRPPAEDPWRCVTCGRADDDHPFRHPFRRPQLGRRREDTR